MESIRICFCDFSSDFLNDADGVLIMIYVLSRCQANLWRFILNLMIHVEFRVVPWRFDSGLMSLDWITWAFSDVMEPDIDL